MTPNNPTSIITDPFKFASIMWPDIRFYDKQAEVIESVINDDMTVVPAGNMLGKDFIAGFIAVWFFASRSPCRVVTTSAKDDHLRVLWGEIKRFVQTSRYPISVDSGGPLIMHHREMRRQLSSGMECPMSYVKGMVASSDSMASMQGHHCTIDSLPRTLFICDESSSVAEMYWTMAKTWAKRALVLGNPWPCTNFFFKAVCGDPAVDDPGGDVYAKDGKRCYRRVIRIRAEDSPNVRLALSEKADGKALSNRIIVPGVKDYEEYIKNRETWDTIQQCVSLDAEFYEGAEVRLYPPEWLGRAASIAQRNRHHAGETCWMGVDPAEGGDSSVWTVVNKQGILEQLTLKTPDTATIPRQTLALMNKYNIQPKNVAFDAGGGGKQHVDYLRNMDRKYNKVRAVGFGRSASSPFVTVGQKTVSKRTDEKEVQYVYANRRAEMYGILRNLLDPSYNEDGFGIPARLKELTRQLKPLPLQFDEEGRMFLPPKSRKDPNGKKQTLIDVLGRSPDEADSLVLATFAMQKSRTIRKLGKMF